MQDLSKGRWCALSIQADLKLRRNGETIDRWILRRPLIGVLPDDLLSRSSTTLWPGAGVGFLLAMSAEDRITDEEFHKD